LLNKERRFTGAATRSFETRRAALVSAARGLGRPEDILGAAAQRLDRAVDRLRGGLRARLDKALTGLARTSGRLTPGLLAAGFAQRENKIAASWSRIADRTDRILNDRRSRLAASARVLSAVSYQNVLERGFALVRSADGALLRRAGETAGVAGGEIQFADGVRGFEFASRGPQKTAKKAEKSTPSKTGTAFRPRQPRLFD
jgi:exodeoxyribonuclease VII large subunit